MIIENLPILQIHQLTQAQYDEALENEKIDENAIYLTPYEEIDLTPYATKNEVKNNYETKVNVAKGLDEVKDYVDTALYAGSTTSGGSAISAEKLNTDDGSATQPIYFKNGIPVKTTYALNKTVPSDAKFTDTTYSVATDSIAGLMSANDKKKLDGIAENANNYTYTLPVAGSTLGGVKTTSAVTSTDGLIACPIISGVPYYKNTTYSNMTGSSATAAGKAGLVPAPSIGKQTSFLRGDGTWAVPPDTTYTLSSFGITASATELNYVDGVTSGIQNQLNSKLNNYNPTGTGHLSLNRKASTNIGTYSVALGSNTTASGNFSTALGSNTTASGLYSFAEGSGTIASGEASHAEGYYTKAIGNYSHAEGEGSDTNISISGAASAITYTVPSYQLAGAQRYKIIQYKNTYASIISIDLLQSQITLSNTLSTSALSSAAATLLHGVAYGEYSHAEGTHTTSSGEASHAEGQFTIASNINAHAEGRSTKASGTYSHAEGLDTAASGDTSHAEGKGTEASGEDSHAEGYGTKASGDTSHAEGNGTIASNISAHAEGYGTVASGDISHAEGYSTIASGAYSHAEGYHTVASGNYSHAGGSYTTANVDFVTAIGVLNSSCVNGDRLVVGSGWTNADNSETRKNMFRINNSGIYGNGSYNSTGADYAEYFEWEDKNLNNEDRIGFFVTLQEDKIKIASSDDEIIGIVSGNASLIGDSYDDQWQGMLMTDIYGRIIYEEVLVTYKDGKTALEKQPKLNPNYNPDEKYIPRSQRKEWDIIGLMGKLIVRDDGTCEPNKYCACNENGIATYALSGYRVMKRLDENHIQILFR